VEANTKNTTFPFFSPKKIIGKNVGLRRLWLMFTKRSKISTFAFVLFL
jgi:hypothetical protein